MKASMTIVFEENATAASMAASLRMQAALLEGKTAKEAASRDNTDGDDEAEEAAPVKKKKAAKKAAPAAKSFDDDEDDDGDDDEPNEAEQAEESEDDDDEDFTAPAPKKAAKAKKVTVDDVNDACKSRAKRGGAKGRAEVLSILKKKFKTESISEIKPELYGKVVEAMSA